VNYIVRLKNVLSTTTTTTFLDLRQTWSQLKTNIWILHSDRRKPKWCRCRQTAIKTLQMYTLIYLVCTTSTCKNCLPRPWGPGHDPVQRPRTIQPVLLELAHCSSLTSTGHHACNDCTVDTQSVTGGQNWAFRLPPGGKPSMRCLLLNAYSVLFTVTSSVSSCCSAGFLEKWQMHFRKMWENSTNSLWPKKSWGIRMCLKFASLLELQVNTATMA